MVQFYEGAKSWNGAVSWYSKSWNGAIIEKNMYIKAARRTFMSAGCALFYSHSIVEGGFEEMS